MEWSLFRDSEFQLSCHCFLGTAAFNDDVETLILQPTLKIASALGEFAA
jgi:hypothetical protein